MITGTEWWTRGASIWPALLLACSASFAQPARRAVLIDVDGIRRDTFEQAYQEGRLPNFARIFAGALWFDNATAVLPTVTMAAQASIVTGTPPSRHGVVGNQWYDRDEGRLIDYMNANGISCVYGFTVLGGPGCLTGLANRHLEAPTMYEAAATAGLASVAVYNQYWRGASRPAAPTAAEAAAFLKENTLDYLVFDIQMTGRVIGELQARGLPSILTAYFAGADGVGHSQGIAAQVPYLSDAIDPLLGRILDTIEGLDLEWRASTLFVFTSDHGRTSAVPHPEDRRLLADLEDALPARAHVAVNGGMAYVYLDQPDREALPTMATVLAQDPKLSATVASVRARGAEDSPRAGDLIVTLQRGHYFGNTGIGSQHGSIYSEDLSIPLLVSMPRVPGGHVSEPVSHTQIARTIAEFLGFPMDSADPALPIFREQRGKNPAGPLTAPARPSSPHPTAGGRGRKVGERAGS